MLRSELLSRQMTDVAISSGKRRGTRAQYLRRAPPDDDTDLEPLGCVGWTDYTRLRDSCAFASLEDHSGRGRAPFQNPAYAPTAHRLLTDALTSGA
jgi:hypothetical protein